jgi:hypothetical protein
MHPERPRIVRQAVCRAAVVFSLLGFAACAGPIGSMASPVSDAPYGSTRVSVSGGRGQSWGERPRLMREAQRHSFMGANVDFGQGQRRSWGLGAGALLLHKPETTVVSPMLSYRGEAPLSSGGTTLFVMIQASTITVDKDAVWNYFSWSRVPVVAPLIGLRQYLPLGSGGLMVSQGAWVAVPSVLLPGSLALDLPLGPLHLLPELRWDLLAYAFRDFNVGATLSGYLSLALHLD